MSEPIAEKKNGSVRLNFGDMAHIAEIAIVVGALIGFYVKVDQALVEVSSHSVQLERIEHYLSSKDANYWKLSKEDQ